MSNIKLYQLSDDHQEHGFAELPKEERPIDAELRLLLEENLYPMLGLRVLASNYPLHSNQEERIPTLGLDENNRPTIVHYGSGALALGQGLFYLNWLMDHRADFDLQVILQLGNEANGLVQWHIPRLVCLSERVASYALHTAAQAAVTVEILRYCFYGDGLFLLERMKPPLRQEDLPAETLLRVRDLLQETEQPLQRLYLQLQQTIFSLCDDLELIVRDRLIVMRRLRNVAAVAIERQQLTLYLNLLPHQITVAELSPDFIDDAAGAEPYGAGRIAVRLTSAEQLARVLPLLQRSIDNG